MTDMRVLVPAFALAFASLGATAQGAATAIVDGPLAPAPVVPQVELAQRLGASLPLQSTFTDSTGRALRLGDEFGASPVILVLGYYRCPQLCGLLMQGLLQAAQLSGLPASASHIVFVSIDPADAPSDAAIRRRVAVDYARFLDQDGASPFVPAIDMLVGPPASVAALARSVGYTYESTSGAASASPEAAARFAHPAGAIVLTPDGRVSRYLMGVAIDPRELRAALVEADGGRVGTITDRIALMCAHLDAHVGRWSTAVLQGLRVLGLATMLFIGALVWRGRSRVRAGSR